MNGNITFKRLIRCTMLIFSKDRIPHYWEYGLYFLAINKKGVTAKIVLSNDSFRVYFRMAMLDAL